MYSMQHVLWRGAMALSLMVVGGLGAYSSPVETNVACTDAEVIAVHVAPANVVASRAVALRHVQFDTVVVYGIPPKPKDA